MISIVVPVYNTEKYLPECIDSILAQEYQDLEVILVDDGSTDNSFKICTEYAKKDQRVKAFHKENSGVSDTRNFGIDHAMGEYISFCDSDDVIVPGLYGLLYGTMVQQDVDRVVNGYAYLYDNGRTVYSKPRLSDGKYDADYILSKMIDDGTLSGFLFSGVCNSLFKKEIIYVNQLRFDKDIKYNEDSLFSFLYMLHSQSVYSMQSHPTYLYRQHKTNSTKRRINGDNYALLRSRLLELDLAKMNIGYDIQMKRRAVTEALWEVLDISQILKKCEAIREIKRIANKSSVRVGLADISVDELNTYKKIYYFLIKMKMASLMYFLSGKAVPILSKYISR